MLSVEPSGQRGAYRFGAYEAIHCCHINIQIVHGKLNIYGRQEGQKCRVDYKLHATGGQRDSGSV